MYFWHINDLASTLKKNHVSILDIILYLFMHVASFILGIHVINLLPTLYHLTFTSLKKYLEYRTPVSLQVSLNVYSYLNESFLIINGALVLAVILLNLIMHRGSIRQFLERFIAFSWTSCFRIMVITFLFFLLGIIISGIYFSYKFSLLTEGRSIVPPTIVRPFKFLFKATGILPIIQGTLTQAQMLAHIQKIFNQFNVLSYGLYWLAHIGSLLSTLWWMLTVQEKIKKLW